MGRIAIPERKSIPMPSSTNEQYASRFFFPSFLLLSFSHESPSLPRNFVLLAIFGKLVGPNSQGGDALSGIHHQRQRAPASQNQQNDYSIAHLIYHRFQKKKIAHLIYFKIFRTCLGLGKSSFFLLGKKLLHPQ